MTQETMQIRVTTPGGFIHGGVKFSEGDVSTELHIYGKYFVDAGWAVDTSGTYMVPPPAITDVILAPTDSAQFAETPILGN